jgi:hypothetical protein
MRILLHCALLPDAAMNPLRSRLKLFRASLSLQRGFLTALFFLCSSAIPAQASHFRSGVLSWKPTGTPGQVRFNLTVAFRRDDDNFAGSAPDGFAQTNDIITEHVGETEFDFDDGNTTDTLRFRVSAFSADENYIVGEALNPGTDDVGILHTYTGAGPFAANIYSCCRIGDLNNRGGGDYRLETLVTPQNGNSSPASLIVPTVRVTERSTGNPAKFLVPASDPDGDRLRFRLSTDEEAGGDASPPNLTIDPNTGEASWYNSGLDQSLPFTVQIVVED